MDRCLAWKLVIVCCSWERTQTYENKTGGEGGKEVVPCLSCLEINTHIPTTKKATGGRMSFQTSQRSHVPEAPTFDSDRITGNLDKDVLPWVDAYISALSIYYNLWLISDLVTSLEIAIKIDGYND